MGSAVCMKEITQDLTLMFAIGRGLKHVGEEVKLSRVIGQGVHFMRAHDIDIDQDFLREAQEID